MDFTNERYVRLYVRDTVTWKRLGWDGQNALTQLLRKADRSGVIDLNGIEPWEAVVVLCGAPEEQARRGMARLLELEVVAHEDGRLLFPRYLEANECKQSDAQRQRESRARRGPISRNPPPDVTKRDHKESQNVTDCHGQSQGVTGSHTESQTVTPCLAVPSVPYQPVPCVSENAHARESSARFEKPPVGEAPPNTAPSEPRQVSPETRCWQLYQRALGTEHLLLPVNHREALSVLASAAKGEADGASQGEAFERAVQRILAAWMAEKYWKDKRPGLRNLAERIEAGHLVRPKAKPVVKLVGAPLKASECHSDEDLLAWPAWREGDLDIYQKQRRWELQAQLDERKAGAAQ